MSVWIVFTGEYEQWGPFGPAFTREDLADAFAKETEGEVLEFTLHAQPPRRATHYRCQGWLRDPRLLLTETYRDKAHLFSGLYQHVQQVAGFWIEETSWDSWDVLIGDQIDLRTAAYSGPKDAPHNYAEAKGADGVAVRRAVLDALSTMRVAA